jgi:cell division protein FtsQ
MDDRGRLAQSLNWFARPHLRLAQSVCARAASEASSRGPSQLAQWLDRRLSILARRLPRAAGLRATAIVILASIAYGIVKGDHLPAVTGFLKDARDSVLDAAGLRIASVGLTGNQHVSREEVLAIAGVTGTTSLIFLDVERARERLKSNPWIADATVLKLYPRELQISIKEREAFALWQKERVVSVIADDGTVIEPYVAPRLIRLPLVVGIGAGAKAKDLLALLDRHPTIREFVRASVLVGERRWNLRLNNGIEVRLPETGAETALDRLVALDREKNLITRDIVIIDLRLPDRVTVRLSDAAAQARIEVSKEKPKKKAGNA